MKLKGHGNLIKLVNKVLSNYPSGQLKRRAKKWFMVEIMKEKDMFVEFIAEYLPDANPVEVQKRLELWRDAARELTGTPELTFIYSKSQGEEDSKALPCPYYEQLIVVWPTWKGKCNTASECREKNEMDIACQKKLNKIAKKSNSATFINNDRSEEKEFFELDDGQQPLEIDESQRKIFALPSDPAIIDLHRRYLRGKVILNPEFQRFHVWDRATSSRLIESVLLNVPIPIIYLAEENDGNYSLIDGQQRLRAFFDFLENKLELHGLTVLQELNGKEFNQISPDYQDKLENSTIHTIEIKKESSIDIKFEIFERLNRGSMKLNDQELRNCIYRGKYNQLINTLALNKDFLGLLGLKEPHKRMFDRELVLRFFSMYHATYLKYKPPAKQFMNSDMEKYRNVTEEDEKELTETFKKTVQMTKTVFADNAFKRFVVGTDKNPNGEWERRRINQALFDVIMFGFSQYGQNQVIPNSDAIREELIWLMSHDTEFIESIIIGTSDRPKVYSRFEKWLHALKSIVGSPRTEPRNFSLDIKEKLFKNNPTCAICQQRIHNLDDSEVDHIEHYWRGGKTIPENARLTHRYCNRARGGSNNI